MEDNMRLSFFLKKWLDLILTFKTLGEEIWDENQLCDLKDFVDFKIT